MTMPEDGYYVRHFLSERNAANRRLGEENDMSYFTKELTEQPTSHARLDPEGVEQAGPTSAWLRDNAGLAEDDGYYVSSYIRAMESAYLLNLPYARWQRRNELRERSAGEWESLSTQERIVRAKAQPVKTYERDPWNWRAPNGESFADVAVRVWQFFHMQHESGKKRSITMCHGYVLLVIRFLLERMPDEEFREVYGSKDPQLRTHNGIILHYTRRHEPANPASPLSDDYQWVRSICAWNPSLVSEAWRPIERRTLSNDDLRRLVERHKRLLPAT
jgi:broad specificity phosphatase PhoE